LIEYRYYGRDVKEEYLVKRFTMDDERLNRRTGF
jgi:hypothetical protein